MSSKKQQKKKASPKKASMSKAELRSSASALRRQLSKTEAKLTTANDKTARWKKEATAQRKAAAGSEQRVEKLRKKLDRAEAAGQQQAEVARPGRAAASRRPQAKPRSAGTGTTPDQGWTVRQLRAEARARGLVGMSNKPKAQLLAALS